MTRSPVKVVYVNSLRYRDLLLILDRELFFDEENIILRQDDHKRQWPSPAQLFTHTGDDAIAETDEP